MPPVAEPDRARLEERAARLRELLERDAQDATSWFGLGRALLELEQAGEAIEPFRRAVAIDPDYTAAHRDLGRALMEAGDAKSALHCFERAARLADTTGDLQTGNEARVFQRRAEKALGIEREAPAAGDAAPRARRALARSAEEGVSPAHALYKQGFDHFANDRVDEAIALYRKALEIDPELAIAWNGLSLAFRQKGDMDAAVEAGRRLIELEPDDPLSHTNLSILYMRQGLIPEAEEEKAIAMQLQMRAQRR
ncbi:MAG: tetratricopeptide repeat protein [Myxococcota bacterium]